jgi:septal ring factor EnvC (AmiA/AmiB activator)
MRGTVKKGPVQKTLDKLTDEEHLIAKQYNSKIYLINQNFFSSVSDNDLKEVDDGLEATKNELDVIKQENAKLQSDYRNLNTTLTNEELDKKLVDLRKQVYDMENKLKKIESGNIIKVPEEKVKVAEDIYSRELNKYKKTKKICNNILNSLADGLEINKQEIKVD